MIYQHMHLNLRFFYLNIYSKDYSTKNSLRSCCEYKEKNQALESVYEFYLYVEGYSCLSFALHQHHLQDESQPNYSLSIKKLSNRYVGSPSLTTVEAKSSVVYPRICKRRSLTIISSSSVWKPLNEDLSPFQWQRFFFIDLHNKRNFFPLKIFWDFFLFKKSHKNRNLQMTTKMALCSKKGLN